jgi:protoporphyrinogen oxidase
MKTNRRKLLLAAGSLTIISLIGFRKLKGFLKERIVPGSISGANFSRGHLIRDPQFEGEIIHEEIPIVIIGGGVSGLSAGYHLAKSGVTDFKILDLENRVGGNSSSASNSAGSYPLGAHYVPLASSEATELKEFFRDSGVIVNEDLDNPEYNDFFVCSAPQDRLFLHGRWQENLEPKQGVPIDQQNEFRRFFSLMDKLKISHGKDGLRAFAIPMSRSSKDSKFLKYDQMTMKDFLIKNEFLGEYIHWYVNYCCLDDYGAPMELVSAWAGIHYFASRNGEGKNLTSSDVITWPQGNGWFVDKLSSKIQNQIQLNSLIYEVIEEDDTYLVKTFNFESKKRHFIKCEKVIYASPLFIAKRTVQIKALQEKIRKINIEYSPWMTANILFKGSLDDSSTPLCWDNVNYHGKSLGYIYGNHQNVNRVNEKINLTQYWPLIKSTPQKARIRALTKTHQEWCEDVISELELTHTDVRERIERIDVSLWGHAMAIPKVGFLNRINQLDDNKSFIFAHTDHAGVSIFEEAFYQGLNAANKIIKGQS